MTQAGQFGQLRVYLVDDEPLAVERLARLLQQTGRVEIVGASTVPEEAVSAVVACAPDVCFLDIQMPRLNGFDVLAQLSRQPLVVFTTAHDRYALEAFAVNSVDYLLKPVQPQQLDRALNKIERLRETGAQQDLRALLEQLRNAVRPSAAEYPERIASRVGNRLCFLDLARVSHFCALDKLTYAVSDGNSYCVDHTVAQLEQKLDPKKFLRIHRATIVNIAWIREVTSLPGGSLNARLEGEQGAHVIVARDRAREFKSWLGC